MATIRIDRSDTDEVNLAALRRIDSAVESIVSTCSHVALYQFDAASKSWHKRNIDGSFFIVRRAAHASPRYRLVIVNRSSPTDFLQDVLPNLDLSPRAPYLMFRQRGGGAGGLGDSVMGVWFSSEEDLHHAHATLARLVKEEKERVASGGGSSGSVAAASGSSAPVAPLQPSVAALFGRPAAAAAAAAGGSGASTAAASAPAAAVAGAALLQTLTGGKASGTSGGGASSSSGGTSALGDVSIVLSKSQLAVALTELLAHDDDFVSALHRKYLEVVARDAASR